VLAGTLPEHDGTEFVLVCSGKFWCYRNTLGAFNYLYLLMFLLSIY